MTFSLFVLLTIFSGSLLAAESFGGIRFHSTVLPEHKEYLKADLTFLYRLPGQEASQDILQVTELSSITGPSLHYWLVDRVRHIVGEEFHSTDETIAKTPYWLFPKTPLPHRIIKPVAPSGSAPYKKVPSMMIMSNLGAISYNLSKETKILRTYKLDGFMAPSTSPRVGVIKVGEGLFSKRMLFNDNPVSHVNMISRLMTLFHEARHSDGEGERAGFFHAYCPPTHTFAMNLSCETSGNGPYSVGAIVLKQLIKNCKTCSTVEKTKLEAKVADSFNRVLKVSDVAKIYQISSQIKRLQEILTLYKTKKTAESASEVSKLEKQIAGLRTSLAIAEHSKTPPLANARPEGVWRPRQQHETMDMMEKSLKK